MATVIERLVIQGCNPLAPPQPARCSSQPYRQVKAPAATPITVTPLTARQSRPSSALTIFGKSTGPTSVAPEAPRSAGSVRKVPEAGSAMQPAALPAGGTSPIVRKMEYLALVRQARHGMSSGDAAPRCSTGTSHVDGDPFIIEGRTVTSQMSTTSCQSSVSSRQGNKKTHFASSIGTPDAFMYSDSDISSIGEHPEGHVDQFQLLQMTQHPRGGRAGSIRSVRSDSSNRSLQLPTLTRGSSEPGVSRNTPSWKHKQGRWMQDSDCDELTAVANHLLLVRQQFKLATSAPERNRTTKPATPRSAYSGCRAEELKSCLNISGQPILESGAPTTERDEHRWTSSKHKLVQNQSGRQSEGALLYKRHKLMEKVTKGAPPAHKYSFSSVSSYLNFNKLNPPSSTSQSSFADHFMFHPQGSVPGADAPTSGSGSSSKPAISATSLKRSQAYKHDSTIINDLEDYFTVKTPRFDPKSKVGTGSGNSGVRAPAPTPRIPLTAASGGSQSPGINYRMGYTEAQEVSGIVAVVTAVTAPGAAGVKRGPIVSVPSAATEHCSESVTS